MNDRLDERKRCVALRPIFDDVTSSDGCCCCSCADCCNRCRSGVFVLVFFLFAFLFCVFFVCALAQYPLVVCQIRGVNNWCSAFKVERCPVHDACSRRERAAMQFPAFGIWMLIKYWISFFYFWFLKERERESAAAEARLLRIWWTWKEEAKLMYSLCRDVNPDEWADRSISSSLCTRFYSTFY